MIEFWFEQKVTGDDPGEPYLLTRITLQLATKDTVGDERWIPLL